MRILWIGKRPTGREPGDEVFDGRTIAACRRLGHTIDLLHPEPVGRLREIGNILSGLPHYRTRFASAANIEAIRQTSRGYDGVICSWEPFDALVRQLSPPCIMILHNVTSRALPSLFPRNPLATLCGARAQAWEAKSYRAGQFAAIATLSRRDFAYLEKLECPPKLMLLPPGMPPCADLMAEAPLLREIVISGTFDWVPKHRDMLRFAQEYPGVDQPALVRAHDLPAVAARHLQPILAPLPYETHTALRFGLITDRFEAGHKLKTLAYIAANQIVLSFADVGSDFAHIPDCSLFIRKVRSVAEIGSHLDAMSRWSAAELRHRFIAFKQECARTFTWDYVAATLITAAADMAYRESQQLVLTDSPPVDQGRSRVSLCTF